MTHANYRILETGRTWRRWPPLAICRWNLWLAFRGKLFWLLLSLGLLHFLLFFAIIYAKAQIRTQNPGFERFMDRVMVTDTGDAYREFLNRQSQAVMILLAYTGVVLVLSDFRKGGLAFYLSRPIGKFQYLLGKGMAIWLLIGMLTLLPGLILFAAYGLFANSLDYWWDNPRILIGIVGKSLVLMTALSLFLLAIAAVCKNSTSFVITWTAIFFFLRPLSDMLHHVFGSPHWKLLSPWRNLRIASDLCFGTSTFEGEWNHSPIAGVIVLVACVLSVVVVIRKVQPIEVVE